MKKLMAVSTAILIATGAMSVNAADADKNKIQIEGILNEVKENGLCDGLLKDRYCDTLWQILDAIKDCTPFPDADGPSSDKPSVDKPSEDKPSVDKPETDSPSADKPSEDKPSADKPDDLPDSKPDTPESSYEVEILNLVNGHRASYGLDALVLDSGISSAALVRAKEITRSFSHTRPDGSSCFTVLSQMGISYNGAGENIAYGQDSAQEVVSAWMNSQGHRDNILNSSFTKLGVGVYSSGGTLYFVQLFTY